jgi:NitT/TauT family transport system ATP-binding protein
MMKNIFNKNQEPEVIVTSEVPEVTEVPEVAEVTEVTEVVKPSETAHKTHNGKYSDIDVINLNNITQTYENPNNPIFLNFNLDIKDIAKEGQFITIMGKSGCGKSTLLRYISGLQKPTTGEVMIYGKKRTDNDRIPMVFQQYTSFEWKTVLENVALPLILKGVPDKEAKEKSYGND